MVSPSPDTRYETSIVPCSTRSATAPRSRSQITVPLTDQPRNGSDRLRPRSLHTARPGYRRLSAPPEVEARFPPDPDARPPRPPTPRDLIASFRRLVGECCSNLVPGSCTATIYQRRWKAYWICSLIPPPFLVRCRRLACLAGEAPLGTAEQQEPNRIRPAGLLAGRPWSPRFEARVCTNARPPGIERASRLFGLEPGALLGRYGRGPMGAELLRA